MSSDLIQDHVVNQVVLGLEVAKVKIILLSGLCPQLLDSERLVRIHVVVLELADEAPLDLFQFDLGENATVPRTSYKFNNI